MIAVDFCRKRADMVAKAENFVWILVKIII